MSFKIKRLIDGNEIEIELTKEELAEIIKITDRKSLEPKDEYTIRFERAKNHNFEVALELRDDLTASEKESAEKEINKLMKEHQVKKIYEDTYIKDGIAKDFDDFNNVAFFYFDLEDIKQYFKKLELFDFWTGGHKIAV